MSDPKLVREMEMIPESSAGQRLRVTEWDDGVLAFENDEELTSMAMDAIQVNALRDFLNNRDHDL